MRIGNYGSRDVMLSEPVVGHAIGLENEFGSAVQFYPNFFLFGFTK